jgi:outer membrane protein insertion porin family
VRLLSLALMFVVVFAPSVASAAEEFVIRDIIVEGGVTLTVDTVSYYLGLEPGDPLDQDSIADGYHRLWDSGLFESVKIEAEDHGGGEVTLFIVVEERPFVTSVDFEGNKKIKTTDLKDKLDEVGVEPSKRCTTQRDSAPRRSASGSWTWEPTNAR